MNSLTPDITAAEVVRHGVLRLTFADGMSGEVDVLDRMRGPVFEDARTPKGFARVETDPETGTVVWPGGADLAPDTLYARVRSGATRYDNSGISTSANATTLNSIKAPSWTAAAAPEATMSASAAT